MSANVDQRRVLKFGTLEEFNSVSSTLEYPGLFMIGDKNKNDEDGTPINRTAKRAAISAIANADFGDLLLENKSTNKPLVVPPESYDTETYPTEAYDVIAVCIYDAASRNDGRCIFMSIKFMDYTTPETGSRNTTGGLITGQQLYWGYKEETGIPGIKLNNTDSLYINEEVKKLVTVDWSGDTVPNTFASGSFPAFECCWRYHTLSTSPGDWIFGNYGDYSKIFVGDNAFIIGDSLNLVGEKNFGTETSTEVDKFKYLDMNGNEAGKQSDKRLVRALYIVQAE